MDENVIFATQNITGFTYNSTFGAFWQMIAPSPFELIEGQEYTILWDDVECTRTAFAFTNPADGTACIAVGNKMVSTGVNDGDLFAIVNDTTNNYTHFFSIENKTEHSVGIYQTVEDEPQEEVGIVIKNYSGVPIEYKGVEKVMFNTADGGKRVYSKGEALEDVSIELDFSSGNQTVKAAEGTLVKSAVIKKPDTLAPENIVKDVEIAGVVGTSEGGGGGELDDMMTGTIKEISSNITTIRARCFYYLDSLVRASFPNVTKIPDSAFYHCTSLEELELGTITEIGDSGFYYCKKLTNVNVKMVQKVGASAFGGCKNITKLDFGTSLNSQIGNYAFSTGYPLDVIIRNTTMIPDGTSQYHTFFGNTTQRLFVPRSMVSTWKASNYMKTYYSNQVFAIEDYPDICG